MTKTQHDTVNSVIDAGRADSSVLGVILCGSLARGTERDDSDVDVFIVVDDERFARAAATKELYWTLDAACSGGHCEVDGKLVSKAFLRKAAEVGTESIRSTLSHAKVIYSVDPEIEGLLAPFRNAVPESRENARKFYALMKSRRFTADDDVRNVLQVRQSIIDTVTYACRLVLAHNGVLFPCAKNMEREIEFCADKPANFNANMRALLESFSLDDLGRFYDEVDEYYREYRFDDALRKGYVIENEWFWYFGIKPYGLI